MDAFAKEYQPWMLAKSVSQCSIKFQRKVTDGVVFKKTWRNNISFKKENEKSVITNESLDTNYCKVQDCKIFVHVSIIKHKHPLRGTHTKYCVVVLTLEMNNWKFMFPWRKVNWHVLQRAKVHFRYMIWFVLKKLLRGTQVHVSSLWWCMHLQKVKPSTNKTYKKTCVPEFPILSNLKNYLHVYLWLLDMNRYKKISKHSWKKIVQLLWTVI